MADPPPHSDYKGDTGDGTGGGPSRRPITGTPPWVQVFGIIALVLVLLFVILHLTGRGLGCHTPPGAGGGQKPLSSVTEHGARQP